MGTEIKPSLPTTQSLVNSLLPFLDPQLAACVLLWAKINNVGINTYLSPLKCESADLALRELLGAYPVGWATELLDGGTCSGDAWVAPKFEGEEGAWNALQVACLGAGLCSVPGAEGLAAAMSEVVEPVRVAGRVLELAELLDGRFASVCRGGSNRGDARVAAECELVNQTVWLVHRALWLLMKLGLPHANNHSLPNASAPNASAPNASATTASAPTASATTEDWSEVVDWLFSERVVQSINLIAPQLIRYYVVLVLPSRKRTEQARIIGGTFVNFRHKLDDPFQSFCKATYHEISMARAQDELALLPAQCAADYWLCDITSQITQHARALVFDFFVKTHRSLNLDKLLAMHGPDTGDDDQWIAAMIKDAKLDAKIDDARHAVEMPSTVASAYTNISEKTLNLFNRTQTMILNSKPN
ncbi:putative eukaryotic translation initiation factor 3 subunit E [Gregarina niphandrodes]|uniref:Eukaryotic translation initiation factor 3 subunit E n=1 Tax=Gregarina niphandrodes TaxID=110365 RepID=A0A023AY61_GRENI|nr:putative eukaryotic translation initiation factor 3 subunit E [Gregarina niphandrodes]EZG43597.1 putative eukaryotic translation initiation factor 3 subunit E [Gregarina niphandrodes]|eukprot:XP_011133175.1 putative eukaryotic translation initiation factor 3 subunit E [Gregarina niphandrodes]